MAQNRHDFVNDETHKLNVVLHTTHGKHVRKDNRLPYQYQVDLNKFLSIFFSSLLPWVSPEPVLFPSSSFCVLMWFSSIAYTGTTAFSLKICARTPSHVIVCNVPFLSNLLRYIWFWEIQSCILPSLPIRVETHISWDCRSRGSGSVLFTAVRLIYLVAEQTSLQIARLMSRLSFVCLELACYNRRS